MRQNKRYIDITDYIRVGYNYMKDMFYVMNKGAISYRANIPDIQAILHSLNITDIEDSTIEGFKDTYEEITNLSYTLYNTGAYISSIQFNDFSDYPLILNCEKAKLYIQNSPIVFDLNTQESPKIVRVPRLCSFYQEKLGLYISQADMLTIYSFLTSYFLPTCYVQLASRDSIEDPLYYGDTLILSDYSNIANVVYYWKYNPLNLTTPSNIADIIGTDTDFNTITLKQPLTPDIIKKYNIKEESKVIINNLSITVGDTPYSCDGTYTINSIEDNTIYVQETIPVSYSFPYYTLSCITDTYNITSISRDENSITLDTTPDNVLIGNTICIIGTTITTEYESISCDGTYTVNNIEGNTVYVEEQIHTNYTGSNATLYKILPIGNIESIENNTIFLEKTPEITMTLNKVIVYNSNINTVYTCINQEENMITVEETIEDYNPIYPQLQYPVPSKEVLISITFVKEKYEDNLPLGDIMLDTPQQALDYLNNYSFVAKPSNELIELPYTEYEPIPSIELTDVGDTPMNFLGLYNEVIEKE